MRPFKGLPAIAAASIPNLGNLPGSSFANAFKVMQESSKLLEERMRPLKDLHSFGSYAKGLDSPVLDSLKLSQAADKNPWLSAYTDQPK